MPAVWRCTIWWPWTAVAQWLKCDATNRKVAGSIPVSVIRIFHWHKILSVALWHCCEHRFYQMWVPGIFPESQGGRCVRLKTLPHPVPLLWNLWTLTSWNHLGHSRPVTGLLYYLVTYIWQHWQPSPFTSAQCLNTASIMKGALCHICAVNT